MLTPIILICCLAWNPTIDSQRVWLDAESTTPYSLGVSVPPGEIVDLTATQGGLALFELYDFTGTNLDLYTVTTGNPVLFYENGEYQGQIVPEPATILLLMIGTLYGRRKCRSRTRI